MSRIALLFDNSLRPETTGVYCRRALGELVRCGRITEVEHFLPDDLARLNSEYGRWDLILAVDDGRDYDLPQSGTPLAYWAIDTHLDFDRSLRRARQSRWIFAAQRNGAERLRESGVAAEWMPLACDPDLHARRAVPRQFDWSFVGNFFPGERTRLICVLRERYPNAFIGQKYFEQMAEIYSASKIVFNRSIADDVNMRVFEALCSGNLLLTNDLSGSGQSELFQDGAHFATYRSDEELLEKFDHYLKHDEIRERVARNGSIEVLAKHTYLHRMERILEIGIDGHVQTQTTGKAAFYFEHARPDVQELVPQSARRILDVGCGSARLGAAIKARQPAHVTGMERNLDAVKVARTRIDDVRVVDLESDEFAFPEDQFDCVICADILESSATTNAQFVPVWRA